MDFNDMDKIFVDYIAKCSSYTYVRLFEYLNCIKITQERVPSKNKWAWLRRIGKTGDVNPYVVTTTANEKICIGDHVTWTYIQDYIKNLVKIGIEDDIELAYKWIMSNCQQKSNPE
jgi:hypothetical protein